MDSSSRSHMRPSRPSPARESAVKTSSAGPFLAFSLSSAVDMLLRVSENKAPLSLLQLPAPDWQPFNTRSHIFKIDKSSAIKRERETKSRFMCARFCAL